MRNAEYIKKKKYNLELVSKTVPETLDEKGHQGIDAIYKNKGGNKDYDYIIVESKYNTAKLGKTKDGLQMSDDWIVGSKSGIDRIYKAVDDPKLATDIKRALKKDRVARVLSKVDKTGKVKTYLLDAKGNEIGLWP